MISLPSEIKPLAELERENPELFRVMKKYQPKRFIPIDWVIISQPPEYPAHQVYGIFVVDKEEVKKKLRNPSKGFPQVKQDFLVYDSSNHTIKYYRGLLKSEKETTILQHIYKFCEKYGDDGKYYGCYKRRNQYLTSNHHYCDNSDPKLPGEQYIRENVKEKLDQAKREVEKMID